MTEGARRWLLGAVACGSVALALVVNACARSEPPDASPSSSPEARPERPPRPSDPEVANGDSRPRPHKNDRGGRSDNGARQRSPAPAAERLFRVGDRGKRVLELQRALEKLGYWLGTADGHYGVLTQQAVLAFQGVERIQRDGITGPQTLRALRSARRPQPRSADRDLIEIDEGLGVLLVVRGGEVRWAFHTSTGTDQPYEGTDGVTRTADTPNGRWKIIYAFEGWRESPLGRLWRPRYFHPDGIAIHGFQSVPPYPASHGCARVTIAAMNYIWAENLAPMGSPVWVY